MFKNKKLVGLFVVLGVLLALAAAKKIFEGQRAVVDEINKEKESTAVLTENILPEAVTAIELYKGDAPDKKIRIKKGDKDLWVLESRYGIRVREALIPAFLKSMSHLGGAVRAASKNVFSDFKIGDKEGLHIVLKNIAGKEMAHLIEGATMPRLGVCFMRRAGDDKVVLVEGDNPLGSLGYYFPPETMDDRSLGDYRLLTLDAKKADRLEGILSKKESYTFVKSGAWAFEPPDTRASLDPAKIEDFLKILSEMTGRDAVDPKGTGYGLEQPQAIVKFSLKEGGATRTAEVQLGGPAAQEGMLYVRVLPDDLIFKVPENAAMNLKQNRAHFIQDKQKK